MKWLESQKKETEPNRKQTLPPFEIVRIIIPSADPCVSRR